MEFTISQALVEYHQPSFSFTRPRLALKTGHCFPTLSLSTGTADLIFPALWHSHNYILRNAQHYIIANCCHGNVCLAVSLAQAGRHTNSTFKASEFSGVMGATLSCRAEWTSASDKGGKLDFSKSNEALLLEVLKFVEDLSREHQREADVVFKRPFVWKTSLSLSNFEPLRRGDEYTFRFVPS